MLKLLEELCSIVAPSGSEVLLHKVIRREIEPFAEDIRTDALGNLIVHIAGNGPKVMFAAHTDEIGIIITHIMDNGMASFERLGNVNAYTALHQRVRFTNGIEGTISYEEKSLDTLKNLEISDLFIDFGTNSREETEKLVMVGDTAGFVGTFSYYGSCVCAANLDNRVGCYVLIEAIKKIIEPKNDLWFVFTSEKELGARGAKTAAYAIKPDYAVAVDVTETGDVPGKMKMAISRGGGVAIKVKDDSIMAHPHIKELMSNVCMKKGILHQYEVWEGGQSDAGTIHQSGCGVPSGGISIPARYLHTPCEMIDAADIESSIRLTVGLIEKGFMEMV